MKQLSLSNSKYFQTQLSYGGELINNKRKSRRPLDTKKPLHVVLRVDTEKPVFLHNDPLINQLIEHFAKKFGIQVHLNSVNANHLHLVISFKHRDFYSKFLKALSGRLAQQFKIKWLHPPFTRVLNWGRDFKNACAYVIKNQKEAWGLISYTPRRKKFPD